MDLYKKIGHAIKSARKARGMNQEELGKLINLSRASVVNIESGKQRITVEKLLTISNATGFKISDFINDSGDSLTQIPYIIRTYKNGDLLSILDNMPKKWLKAMISLYKKVGNEDAGVKTQKVTSVSYATGILDCNEIKEGDFFMLKHDKSINTKNIIAMQVMECWPDIMTVRSENGCMTRPYGDFMKIHGLLDGYKMVCESTYFEDHR